MSCRRITLRILDMTDRPTLADIMAVVNGGRYEPFFLKKPRTHPDGSREFLTRRGGQVYGRLTSLLQATGRLVGGECGAAMEDVVETLDAITTENT